MLRWDNAGDTYHSLYGNGTLHPNNLHEAYFPDGTGDSNTRVAAYLTAGSHDIVFIRWNGNGGNYFEVSAAPGVQANHAAPPFELLSTTLSSTNLYIGSSDDYAGTWGPAQSWTFGGPLTGKADDYDGDGLSNDMERAFGLDPSKGASVSPISVPLDKVPGTFTYVRRNPSLAKLNYSYQWSTTLAGNWTTVVPALADIVTPIAGTDNQTVIVDLTGAPGNPLANAKLFVRVKAE